MISKSEKQLLWTKINRFPALAHFYPKVPDQTVNELNSYRFRNSPSLKNEFHQDDSTEDSQYFSD